MSLLDGQLGKQSFVDLLIDRVVDLDRFFRIAIGVFATSILLMPVVIYFCFAYFTATVGPWWLDVITGLNISAFLLSGLALLVFGLAKLMARRED